MFSWFMRFIKGHRQRFIFRYWDGTRKRSADPLEIERGLVSLLGDGWREKLEELAKPLPPELIGEEAEQMKKEKEELRSKVLYAIDSAFDVSSYKDGKGLTEVERFGTLAAFNRFCIDLVVLARPFVKQQSRASPGSGTQPTASGADLSSQDGQSSTNVSAT